MARSDRPDPDPALAPRGLALAWLALAACGRSEPDPAAARAGAPLAGASVLLVTIDTTRADALSCYGGDPRNTPHLDALAAQGARFDVAYSATNTTCPSHLSLLSGLRLIEHGVFENRQRMDPRLETLPLAFQRAGYATAAFPAVPFLGGPFGWRGFEHLVSRTEHADAERTRRDLLDWLRARDPARPFFAWAHFYDPHTIYAPPAEVAREYYQGDPRAGEGPLLEEEPFLQRWDYPAMRAWIRGLRDPRFPRAMYDGEVHAVDEQIGRVLSYLERAGLAESTIVVVTADHGESFGEHGIFYAHSGLFEPSVRVPLLVRAPGFPAGVACATPVSALDLAPTLVELCGLDRPAAGVGLSLVPLLDPARAAGSPVARRDTIVLEGANNGLVAVRKGDWKLIWPISDHFQRLEHEPHLFDLASDPHEERDLYAERPEKAAELRALLAPWEALGVRKDEGDDAGDMDEETLRQIEALGYAR